MPPDSRYSLRELQDIRWRSASQHEQSEALWIAKAVMQLISPSSTRETLDKLT